VSRFNKDYMIKMKDIVREGAKILRKVTEEVQLPPGDEVRAELQCMMVYLKNSQDPEISKQHRLRPGVGLSANQIGLDKRMFVAYFMDEYGEQHEYMLINPKIISHSVGIIYLSEGEGCLSVDRQVKGYVPRYQKIKVRAFDVDGNEVILAFKGYASIVMQHEIDHLDGVMFYDHIDKRNPYQLPGNVPVERL
jgi:peptide deformylase